MPSVITVSSEIGDSRTPPLPVVVAARKSPLIRWHIADLQIAPEISAREKIHGLVAQSRERKCITVEGESSRERGERLAIRLQEDKAI